jgi:predicted  nucleic acid-binding Zn-ribbon protein
MVALDTTLAEMTRRLDHKERELNDSIAASESANAQLVAKETVAADLCANVSTLERDLAHAATEQRREADAAKQARLDLQHLRAALEAKSSAESQQSHVTRSLEADNGRLREEMSAMRKERTEAERSQAAELTRLRQQVRTG